MLESRNSGYRKLSLSTYSGKKYSTLNRSYLLADLPQNHHFDENLDFAKIRSLKKWGSREVGVV